MSVGKSRNLDRRNVAVPADIISKHIKEFISRINISEANNIGDMVRFPFEWKLHPEIFDQKKNCYVSNLKINAEWNLLCLWSKSNPNRPEYLIIRRNSTSKEIVVSGTFTLKMNSECLLQRKFIQLIEAGFQCAISLIDLQSDCTTTYFLSSQYYITGTLTIPAFLGQENYSVKGTQFESLANLSTDFECLLNQKLTYFSDVNLKCESISFSAHKNILSARSAVFAAMFATQMKENQLNEVDITDISPHVLKIMLTFIYTGKTGELSVQSGGELLFAADKYQLQDLKRICRIYLKSCISIENVLNTLVLGYLHDDDLKEFAIDFICNSSGEFEDLEKTAEWKILREKRPVLAMDVLTCLVKTKDGKLKGRRN